MQVGVLIQQRRDSQHVGVITIFEAMSFDLCQKCKFMGLCKFIDVRDALNEKNDRICVYKYCNSCMTQSISDCLKDMKDRTPVTTRYVLVR